MSELKQKHEFSEQGSVERNAETLRNALGEWHEGIYRQTYNLFPCPELETVNPIFDSSRGDFRGGKGYVDGIPVPMIVIGTGPTLESRNIVDRLISRFGIPRDLMEDEEMRGMICRLVGCAHELGHVVQMNPEWQQRFGGLEEGFYLPDGEFTNEEYQRYLNSDEEGNADYIAACTLARSEPGQLLGIGLPEEQAGNWRAWIEKNPVVLSSDEA